MHFDWERCHGTVQTCFLVVTLSTAYLLVIDPSALLCPGLAEAEPALGREMYPWAWCWKPQRNFAGRREIWSLCTSQHHIPGGACTCTRAHAAAQTAECIHLCWMYLSPPVHVAWLAQTSLNRCKYKYQLYSYRHISSNTEPFLLLLEGIIENLQYSFREG